MKRIDEIINLGIEDLERISDDESVKAPEGLEETIRVAILARELTEDEGKAENGNRSSMRLRRAVIAFGTVAAAACLTLFVVTQRRPKDTFSDPVLAYAELEKTLGYISSKVDRGVEIASQTGTAFETTKTVYMKQ